MPRTLSLRAALLLSAALALPVVAHAQQSVEARARAIHSRVLVFDAHADVPNDLGVGANAFGNDGPGQVDLPKLRRGGFGAVNLAVFAPGGPRTDAERAKARAIADAKLKAINAIDDQYGAQTEQAFTAADVARIHAAGKVAILASYLNAYPLGADLSALDDYYKAGVRTFGFAHAGNNDYADSSRPGAAGPAEEHHGLSPIGRQAVAKLNRLGGVIDVSQLTPAGLLQTVELSKAPVIASHSGIRAIVDNTRNLSDAELDAIRKNGGVAHIVAYNAYVNPITADERAKVSAVRVQYGLAPEFKTPNEGYPALAEPRRADFNKALAAVTGPGSVADFVDSIDYAVKRIGVDHVGIATDFNHGGGVAGYANEGEAVNVTIELVKRGYSEADIAKLWGGNFLRVLGEAERVAGRLNTVAQLP
jgi:membrane dipeptidase